MVRCVAGFGCAIGWFGYTQALGVFLCGNHRCILPHVYLLDCIVTSYQSFLATVFLSHTHDDGGSDSWQEHCHGEDGGCKVNEFFSFFFLTIFLNGGWRWSDSQRHIHSLYDQHVWHRTVHSMFDSRPKNPKHRARQRRIRVKSRLSILIRFERT
jgi:hypothetical protein